MERMVKTMFEERMLYLILLVCTGILGSVISWGLVLYERLCAIRDEIAELRKVLVRVEEAARVGRMGE